MVKIIDFQSSEHMKVILTQVLFYGSFIESTEENIDLLLTTQKLTQKKDKILKQIELMKAIIQEINGEVPKIEILQDIHRVMGDEFVGKLRNQYNILLSMLKAK